MLTQFEKEKSSAQSGSSSSAIPAAPKLENSFLYDSLVELLGERKNLRLQLKKIHEQYYVAHEQYIMTPAPNPAIPSSAATASANAKKLDHQLQLSTLMIANIKTELTLIQEDISSIIAAAGTDIDKKLVKTADNKEANKLSDLKI